MTARPALLAYSLLSAVGALPFLILPVLAGGAMAAGDDTLRTLAIIAMLMTVGEVLSSILCPLVFGGRFRLGQATCATVLLGALFGVSTLTLTPAALACWAGIGAMAGVLQYFGTTIAAVDDNPTSASQLRLAVSLMISGGVVATSSIWIDTGYGPLRLMLAGLVSACAVAVWALLIHSNPSASSAPAPTAPAHRPTLTRTLVAFGSIALFFVVIPPFISALPAILRDQPASDTLLQLGLGKLVAAPLLYLISARKTRHDDIRAPLIFGATIAAAALLAAHSPTVASFALLEIGINACAAILFGWHGAHLGVDQKKWFFLCVQLGSIVGFAALKWIDPALLYLWLPILAGAVPLGLMLLCAGPFRGPGDR